LENLAAVEETVVREKATDSIVQVVDSMDACTSEDVVGMIERLSNGDWFTSRISACSLFACSYPKSDANTKANLRASFEQLCGDDTPMVRRAAAHNLGTFAAVAGQNEGDKTALLNEFLLPLLTKLSTDEQDSVRLLAIENCSKVCSLLDKESYLQHILPIVQASVEDRSWRVRFNVAREFHALAKALGPETAEKQLLAFFCNLLQDAEAEVRAVAAKNIAGMFEVLGATLFEQELVPIMQVLAQDTTLNVRTALAEACMGVAPTLSQESFLSHIVPLLMHFLRDEAPEVRLNVLSRLSSLSSSLDSLSTSLLPVVLELKDDTQWRVREAIASLLPAIAAKMGANYFTQNIQDDIFFTGFRDDVSSVRLAAARATGALLGTLGAGALEQTMVPRLNELWAQHDTTYFVKVAILFACQSIAQAQASESSPAPGLLTALKSVCIKGLNDEVCNVQFTAVMALADLVPQLDAGGKAEVKAELAKLQESPDPDTGYYLQKTLPLCG